MDDTTKDEQERQAFDSLKDAFKHFTGTVFVFMCVVCLGSSLFRREDSSFLYSLMGSCVLASFLATILMGYSNKLEMRGSKRLALILAVIAGLAAITAGTIFAMFGK